RKLDDADQSEVGVNLHDGAGGAKRKADVRIALAVRIQLAGRTVVEDAACLDGPAEFLEPAVPFDFGAHRLAGELHRAAGHHRLSRGGAGPRRSDRRIGLPDDDPIDPELGAYDLRHDGVDALAHLDGGGLDLGDRALTVGRDPHPGLRGIVEAFAVRQVLVADRQPDTTLDRFAVAYVTGATRQQHGVAVEWRVLRWQRQVLQALQTFAHRRRSGDELTGRKHRSGAQRVLQPELDRVEAQRRGQPVHLCLVSEAGLYRPESAHRPAGRVVGEDRRADQPGVGDFVWAGGKGGGV